MRELWYVRSYVTENGEAAYLDEGPWERYFAELVLADIGVDASIPRGISRVEVTRAHLISAREIALEREIEKLLAAA